MRACARPRMNPERGQPRTQTYISCEPAQSQRMSTFHKSHLIWKFSGKCHAPERVQNADEHYCEPTHSKRMSKFHKSHFRWKFRSKMPRPRVTKNPDQAPAFTDTIRTPSVDTLSWEQSLTSMLFHPTSIF